jgi:hypothetical protein
MMKKVLVFLSILLLVNAAFGQAYIVTYLKGDVYHNHKLVKLHDRLDGVTQLTSDGKTAELALFNAQKGKLRLSFVNSKPVSTKQGAKTSELYQLVVGNYLQAYTTEKTLTSRGDFDLKTCLSGDARDDGNKVLLLEGELLPLKSSDVKFNISDKFFICTLKGKDTVRNPISRNNSFLIFDGQAFKGISDVDNPKPVTCYIRRGHTFDGKYIEEQFSGPLVITYLPKENVQGLVSTFQQGLATCYHNDKKKMLDDIEGQLTYYYGNDFEPAVHQVLAALIN